MNSKINIGCSEKNNRERANTESWILQRSYVDEKRKYDACLTELEKYIIKRKKLRWTIVSNALVPMQHLIHVAKHNIPVQYVGT